MALFDDDELDEICPSAPPLAPGRSYSAWCEGCGLEIKLNRRPRSREWCKRCENSDEAVSDGFNADTVDPEDF